MKEIEKKTNKFYISNASVEDVELLTRHRLEMWKDIFPELKEKAERMKETTSDWIKTKLSEGKLIGFIAKTRSGEVAGSGCVWLREDAPRVLTNKLESPYLMSIYTETGYRRTGVATIIIQSAVDWCKQHGYKRITLHASESGIAVYKRFGFKPTTEMRLTIEEQPETP
jgi:GNAT superfamily N-acetyltransferase